MSVSDKSSIGKEYLKLLGGAGDRRKDALEWVP